MWPHLSNAGVNTALWMRHQRNEWICMCTCWTLTHTYLCKSKIRKRKMYVRKTGKKIKYIKLIKDTWTCIQVFILFPLGLNFNWTFSPELLDCDRLCAGYQCSTCFPSGWLCNYPYNSYCIWNLSLGSWAIILSPQQKFYRDRTF